MTNDTKKHETMPLDLLQFAQFKRPQLPAGRAPLLLNPAAADSVSKDVRGERTTKELWQIARNEPTLEQTQFWDSTRFDAVRRLERKGADLDELIRVVETVDPGKEEYNQRQKANMLRDLRSSKAKLVK